MLRLLTFGTCLLLAFGAVHSLTTPAVALAKVQDASKDNQSLNEEIHDIISKHYELSKNCRDTELVDQIHHSLRDLAERIFQVEWLANNVLNSVKTLRKSQIANLRKYRERELEVAVRGILQSSEHGGIFEELSRSPCLSYQQLKDLIVRLYEVIVRAQVKALAGLQSIDRLDSRPLRANELTQRFYQQLSELYGLVRTYSH